MPPRTRACKVVGSKENVGVTAKRNLKPTGKAHKPPRKVLADKTNSASDDNASFENPKIIVVDKKMSTDIVKEKKVNERPRRDRRLPNRFVKNNVLNSLSNNKENDVNISVSNVDKSIGSNNAKSLSNTESSFKTPQKDAESLILARPKRVCRLPSRFDDDSISPRKFIPVQPVLASTPIVENNTIRSRQGNKTINKTSINTGLQRPLCKNFSLRVLEDKKESEKDDANKDVYEFTFDPNEEPPPQNKKKKRAIKKKPAKPKMVVFKLNYEKNITKALNALKNSVSKNPTNKENVVKTQAQSAPLSCEKTNDAAIKKNVISKNETESVIPTNNTSAPIMPNYNSVRIEDIAADFEQSIDHVDINYSPVNSPGAPNENEPSFDGPAVNNDPLNLRDDVSFFDDIPVASSSMNTSVRHPHASPWRVEFQNLPIKWHVNSYVKPNMTPAVESSYVNFNDSKKKHIYTNIVPPSNESLPEIVDKDTSNLKQTSIISFMREVAEKNAIKKRRRSATPNTSHINEVPDKPKNKNTVLSKSPRKVFTPRKDTENTGVSNTPLHSSNEQNTSNENEPAKQTSRENLKRKNDIDINEVPAKTPRKDKNNTFFGFDDSEDQENVSPRKVDNRKGRSLRPRARAVLKDVNELAGPTRAFIPLAAKSKTTTQVPSMYEEIKSAADAPVFPENNSENVQLTNVDKAPNNELIDDDADSVHLFEDIEVVHHLKLQRKSYGKAKKVFFRQNSSDSDDQVCNSPRPDQDRSDVDDLADLTFEIPAEKKSKKKKPKSKQKMSKKEEKEADAWAAGFNSMCEDIEDFPLVIE